MVQMHKSVYGLFNTKSINSMYKFFNIECVIIKTDKYKAQVDA